jgi:predicted PurR-regulated permease PerM
MSRAWHILSWFFIAIIFSFLIVMDLPNLIQRFRSLRNTKLHIIYDETASSVILFAKVVGENFRAQIYISFINTVLTLIGLTLIGTGNTALLSVVVFACGLIPVLGFIISSIPIFLVAINVGGFNMVGLTVLLICIVHTLEAYVLNPRIVSAVMRLNPVMTLIILYIAHAIMGMWGMFLGVPISVYVYRQIAVPRDQKQATPLLMLGEDPVAGEKGGMLESPLEIAESVSEMDDLENAPPPLAGHAEEPLGLDLEKS